jgi:hypothetical protein
MVAAMMLLVYAAMLLGAGVLAYSSAPDGANAKTALIVPGACAAVMLVLAGVVAVVRKGKAARAAHILALVLMLVFAGAFSMRAMKASDGVRAYRNAEEQYVEAIAEGRVEDTPGARAAFYEESGAPDHDKSYLANTLWGLVVASALMFIVGIVTHPGSRINREEGALPE